LINVVIVDKRDEINLSGEKLPTLAWPGASGSTTEEVSIDDKPRVGRRDIMASSLTPSNFPIS
jgi:hypothetical protein